MPAVIQYTTAFALGVGLMLGVGFSVREKQSAPLTPHEAAVAPHPAHTFVGTTTPDGKPYQYVDFAFDGSRSLAEWRETLDFVKAMDASNTPVHFTYFINAIYLVPEAHKNIYHPPHGNPIGLSLIGYGRNATEIGQRVALINEAYASGHEIGSHGVGHIPGVGWSVDDWKSEFAQFADILDRARKGIDTDVKLTVPPEAVQGFRAPALAAGPNLDTVIDDMGYAYDASYVSKVGDWPKMIGKHMELPLALIPYRGNRKILSMDYNFYMADTKAHDTLKKGTPEWQKEHDEMFNAYMNYFNANYSTNRAPLFIGHHFSNWNDGLYWDVMKEAIQTMCGKSDVRCATHQETLEYVKERGK
jgi:hypothetical protein